MALSLPRQNYGLMSRESGGRTAYDYEAMVPIKSDALKRSLAKDRISDEALDANCRDNKSESDNEADGEPAAKLRRGGGRRKQSKPMRMFAELESLPDSEPSKNVSNQATRNSKCFDGTEGIGLLRSPAPNSLVCELCHEYFPSEVAVKDHVNEIHTMVLDEDATKDALCPTKYHVLGKELIQESDFESVGKGKGNDVKIVFSEIKDRVSTVSEADEDSRGSADWMQVKEDEDGMTSSPESSKEAGDNNHEPVTNSSAGRTLQTKLFPMADDIRPLPGTNPASQMEIPHEIGNAENTAEFSASAQTYEAGVQSEMPSQVSAAPTASWDPAKSRIFHPDAYCEICDREFCNKYFLKTHKANKHGIYDSNLTGMEIPTSANSDLYFNVLSQQHQHPPSTVLPKSSPQKQQAFDPAVSLTGLPLLPNSCGSAGHSSPFTPVKLSATDADECCEICQKHFTSRSQLKRHRQEIHGLSSSSQGSDSSKLLSIGGLPVGSPASNPVSASMENPSTPHPLLLPHLPTTSSCSVPSVLSNFGPMANLSNLMFLNPFNPPLAVIPPLFPTPGLGFRPSAMIPLPQLPIQDIQKSTSSSRFPDSPAVPNSLLQSMGVLNAEALMELYRKELCSNYLMRSQEASNRSGLFTAGMAGFQSGMPGMSTSLASSLPFPLPGKLGSQDSVKVKFEMSSEAAEVCEVCKKTFVNKQSLVSHILAAHHSNQDGGDLASELMKLDKLSEGHHFEKTVFNNMAAAKLVDRVQCDICSKEVCNKYFLKTHKIKVHGWDPVSGERETLDKPTVKLPSPPQSQNSVLEQPPMIPDLMSVEKPKEEELLQMGIDPEAYCEICKKEFCNKYFLKTHKQNIHGIKTGTAANPSENRTNPQLPLQSNPLTTTQLSLLVGNQSLQQSLPPVLGAPPLLMPILDAGGHDGAADKRSWKWRDPVNAMRVTCEICNKVLCNKYFLKTHMMKRHGINYDTITGQLTTSVKGQASSEYAPSRDARDETFGSDDVPSLQPAVLSTAEKQNPLSMHAAIRHSGIPEELSSPEEAIERSDNEFRFVPCRPTDRNDRDRCNGIEMEQKPLAVGLIHSETSKALDLTAAATTVMAKTWHVPSDDRQHGDELAGAEYQPGNNVDLTPPSAEIASHRMTAEDDESIKDASRVHSAKEGAFDEAPGMLDSGSQLSSSCEENRNQGGCVQDFVGPGKYDSVTTAAEIAKAAIANHIRSQLNKKLFRCTHCRDRFHSRSQCELHICSTHPLPEGRGPRDDRGSEKSGDVQYGSGGAESSSSSSANSLGYLNGYASARPPGFSGGDPAERKPPAAAVPGLDLVSKQPVTYAQPIDPTNLSSILMQPFLLKEDGGEKRFAASLVYLPALQKINETVSVTFSLTPILQH